jgi:hypothetical protein
MIRLLANATRLLGPFLALGIAHVVLAEPETQSGQGASPETAQVARGD